jgi:hypothetical protein
MRRRTSMARVWWSDLGPRVRSGPVPTRRLCTAVHLVAASTARATRAPVRPAVFFGVRSGDSASIWATELRSRSDESSKPCCGEDLAMALATGDDLQYVLGCPFRFNHSSKEMTGGVGACESCE